MPRPSGGYAAGFVTPVPSANAAAGIWTPRDLYASRAAGTWPVIGTATPAFSTVGYTRLWGLTTKSSGLVTGTAVVDTGFYNVKWWDNTISNYSSGNTFSKAAAGGYRAFEIYPVARQSPDGSTNAQAATLSGNATISSAQSRLAGGTSLSVGGGGTVNSVSVQSQAYFNNWNTGDWTIEMWVRPTSNVGYVPLFSPALRFNIHMFNTGDLHVNNAVDGIDGLVVTSALAAGSWQHIAVVRQSGVSSLYVNGVRLAYGNVPYGTATSGAVAIAENFNGYVNDLRVVRGSAVYSGASFSPPATALTAISGTVLLLNFNTLTYQPTGQFDGFNVSSNNITKLRGESLVIDRAPGFNQWTSVYVAYPHYSYQYVQQYIYGPPEFAYLNNNDLAAADLNQFYTDLGACDAGRLSVQGNPGISADTPSIATAKGYTVFGSVPPATTLLLNGEGANNGTTITDSSVTAQTIRRVHSSSSGPVTSITQFIRGSASILFNGSNWLDNLGGNSANVLNTENFTIEMWVYLASRGAATPIFDLDSAILWRVGSDVFSLFIVGNSYNWSPSTHVPLTTWTHVALVRENDNVRVYAGGVQRLSVTLPANTVIGSNGVVTIGAQANNVATRMTANSYLDDIRLTRGLALYTGTFTPPTAQLTAL